MNKRFNKLSALFVFSLLPIGLPCVVCFVWVRKEQRQYALNRQLIAALKNGDTKEAIALVEAEADPNTRLEPTSKPTLLQLLNQLIRQLPLFTNNSPTALMLACGAPQYASLTKSPSGE